MLLPDTYAALDFPDRPALHALVELDRGTETLATLRDKAERYEQRLDYRFWREVDPVVLFVVPSDRRARTVTDTLAGMSPSLAVIVWSSASTSPALRAVLDAEAARAWNRRREREDTEILREAHALASGRRDAAEGLRSAGAFDLLDHPHHPDEQEPTP